MSRPRAPIDCHAAALGLLVIVAANLFYLTGITDVLEPSLSTDPLYLHLAGQPLTTIFRDPAWGPLYALWLKPFVLFTADPITAYTANLGALSLAVSLLVYLHMLLLTRSATTAATAALLFLVSDLNAPLAGKASAFALLLVVAGLTAAELLEASAARLGVAAVGVLLASYARPELYPAAGLIAATACVQARSSWRRDWCWPALAVALIAGFWAVVGSPVATPADGSSRLVDAVREHFAWNWTRWHSQPLDLAGIWQQEFGTASSLRQALLANPHAFSDHLAANLLGTLRFVSAGVFDHYPILLPAACAQLENGLLAITLWSCLAAAVLRPAWRQTFYQRYGLALLIYAPAAVPSLAAAVVVFPVPAYLALPGVLLLLAAVLAASVVVPDPPDLGRGARWAAALLCLAAVPRPFALPSAYFRSPSAPTISIERPVIDTVRVVRALELTAPVHVLALSEGIGNLLGRGFDEVKIWEKGPQPFADFVRARDVGLIIGLGPGKETAIGDDVEWRRFKLEPEAAGFRRIPIAKHDRVAVYARLDLLPAETAPAAGN